MPPHQDSPLFDPVQVMVVDNDYDDDMMSTMTPDMVAESSRLRCAVLGCGMMGQEHCSYIMGYSDRLQIDFLCDPHQPSLDKCCEVLRDFANPSTSMSPLSPTLVYNEEELLKYANEIDLLVICTPNYLHTDTILRWGRYEHLTILVEKPVAVSRAQHDMLQAAAPDVKARIWVAMEYRFMPAVAKLVSLLREGAVGDIKMVTIRENRFPFLHKVGRWNRDRNKTGDSLVEKWYVGMNRAIVSHLTMNDTLNIEFLFLFLQLPLLRPYATHHAT
jgi:myo-inositol 2-dehydrogenase / D-chiro-inositol 1-dehydrogenase